MPIGILLFSLTTKLLDFSRNQVVISQVHKQQNVRRTNGANVAPHLTLRTWHVHRRLSHMAHCPRSLAVLVWA